MSAGNNVATMMMNAGPLLGVGGGVTALATIPNPETKLFTCAVMFALAAGSALRKVFFTAPLREELGEYPFDSRNAQPWERDGGPHGL